MNKQIHASTRPSEMESTPNNIQAPEFYEMNAWSWFAWALTNYVLKPTTLCKCACILFHLMNFQINTKNIQIIYNTWVTKYRDRDTLYSIWEQLMQCEMVDCMSSEGSMPTLWKFISFVFSLIQSLIWSFISISRTNFHTNNKSNLHNRNALHRSWL